MADQTQAPTTEIKIVEAKSKSGEKYEVGRPDVPQPDSDDRVGSKSDFSHVQVNWTVQGDSWIDTPMDIRNTTAIWRYKLHKSSSPFFDYVLEISITDDHYCYYFGDESGDSYKLDTWVAGDHLVRFNSGRPTIKLISGS
jgi:hypothetical protein